METKKLRKGNLRNLNRYCAAINSQICDQVPKVLFKKYIIFKL